MDIHTLASLGGDFHQEKIFATAIGMIASGLEHGLFEQVYKREGISAVKALSIANSSGIPIYEITQNNMQAVNLLEVSNEVKQDIINNVNAGNAVTVSKTNITFHGWTGVGYIVKDPRTGSAGYMISGGLAGGELPDLLWEFISSLLVQLAEAGDGTRQEQGLYIDPIIGISLLIATALKAIAELMEHYEIFSKIWPFIRLIGNPISMLVTALPYLIAIAAILIVVYWLYKFIINPNTYNRKAGRRYAYTY